MSKFYEFKKDRKSLFTILSVETFSNPDHNRANANVDAIVMTPFFIGRTHFCTSNFGQEAYIHVVAQETRIIKKIFIFFIKKGRNRRSKFDNQKYICDYITIH